MSREQLISFADVPPRLQPPSFHLTSEQFFTLKTALRAIEHLCRASEDPDGEPEAGASLTEQLAAAEAQHEALCEFGPMTSSIPSRATVRTLWPHRAVEVTRRSVDRPYRSLAPPPK